MALKAGRVGVAPEQVDEFGQIKSEATSGYTKQEADAKFETQTAASEALALKQPITLEVPISMLHGSVLTVEGGFAGLVNALTNKELTDLVILHDNYSGDLNDLTDRGLYFCSTPTNSPENINYFFLYVFTGYNDNNTLQVIFKSPQSGPAVVFIRHNYQGNWGVWSKTTFTNLV